MTTLLLAHGAGAGQSHPVMQGWSARLRALGTVVPFEYDYMARGKKAPQRLPRLLETHRQAMAEARAAHGDPVVLIGKSMGGRVGCHLCLEVEVAGVVCLGYPLRSPKGAVRDEVLMQMTTPVLFVQGTRDRLCPLDLLEDVRGRMSARTSLYVVEGGDHSLLVGKRALKAAGQTQADVDARALEAVREFVSRVTATGR